MDILGSDTEYGDWATPKIRAKQTNQITKALTFIMLCTYISILLASLYLTSVHMDKTILNHVSQLSHVAADQASFILKGLYSEGIDIFSIKYTEMTYEDFTKKYVESGYELSRKYFKMIAGGELTRYNHITMDSELFCQRIRAFQNSWKHSFSYISWSLLMDKNGYNAVHHANKRITGNKFKEDNIVNREGRIWELFTSANLKYIAHNSKYLEYRRDTGEIQKVVAAPIYVNNIWWGSVCIGYSESDVYDMKVKIISSFIPYLIGTGIFLSFIIPWIVRKLVRKSL